MRISCVEPLKKRNDPSSTAHKSTNYTKKTRNDSAGIMIKGHLVGESASSFNMHSSTIQNKNRRQRPQTAVVSRAFHKRIVSGKPTEHTEGKRRSRNNINTYKSFDTQTPGEKFSMYAQK